MCSTIYSFPHLLFSLYSMHADMKMYVQIVSDKKKPLLNYCGKVCLFVCHNYRTSIRNLSKSFP